MPISLHDYVLVSDEINDDLKYFSKTRGEKFATELKYRLDTLKYCEDIDFLSVALAFFTGTRFKNILICDECYLQIFQFNPCDNLLRLHKIVNPECVYLKDLPLPTIDFDDEEMLERCVLR